MLQALGVPGAKQGCQRQALLCMRARAQDCYAAGSLAEFRRQAGDDYARFQVIAIDEAQFLPDLLDFCTWAADVDAKHVLLAGLDGDFKRQRFGQVAPFAGAPCAWQADAAGYVGIRTLQRQREGLHIKEWWKQHCLWQLHLLDVGAW